MLIEPFRLIDMWFEVTFGTVMRGGSSGYTDEYIYIQLWLCMSKLRVNLVFDILFYIC